MVGEDDFFFGVVWMVLVLVLGLLGDFWVFLGFSGGLGG